MSSNIAKIAANKFALIYEFNNASPLFARVAAGLLDNSKLDRAIEILSEGIKLYPNYPTAYFVYAKALALAGNMEKAAQMVEAGNDILDDEETKNYYLNLIAEIAEKSQEFTESKRFNFLENESDEKLQPAEKVFEDNLDELAEKLDGAKIELPAEDEPIIDANMLPQEEENNKSDKFDISSLSDGMVSETLADIFLAQGNLKAAKAIFQKLMETEPEKEENYLAKISEIELKLREGNSQNEA